MNSNDNMMSNHSQLHLQTDLKNKGFAIVGSLLKEHGWNLVKNESNWICFTKFGDETSFFDIKILADKIVVTVPIKNSAYQYTTSFKSYYDASEYIEQRLLDYTR